jgi:hypothetical protein
MVKVQARSEGGGWVCEVDVDDAGQRTKHTVNVSAEELRRWGKGDGRPAVEDLVLRSFEFLLRREPPGSILRWFDLSAIERYFPEYDLEIR